VFSLRRRVFRIRPAMKMDKQRLYLLSRNPRIIIRTCLVILVLGIAAALLLAPSNQQLRERRDDRRAKRTSAAEIAALPGSEQNLLTVLRNPNALDPEFHHIEAAGEDAVPQEFRDMVEEMQVQSRYVAATGFLKKAALPSERHAIFENYVKSLFLEGAEADAAFRALQNAAQQSLPRATTLLADVQRNRRNFAEALASYERAASVEKEESAVLDARTQALEMCLGREDKPGLQRLLEIPGWRDALKNVPGGELEAALIAGDYPSLLVLTVQGVAESIQNHPVEAGMSIFCGLLWYVLLHQTAGLRLRSSWLGILAVAAGFFSPAVTLFVLHLQSAYNNFGQSGEFLNDLIYFVAGVGLREELSKLLLFLPICVLLRRKSDAAVLVAAGCVGLGFAIEENINYFSQSLLSYQVWGRFFTANFAHVVMTAISGLALMRWLRYPRSCWQESLLTILGMVVVHGLYDFFISAPVPRKELALGSLSVILYIILAMRFLQLLHRVREPRGNVAGPMGVFAVGISVLFAVVLAQSSWTSGFKPAFDVLVAGALEMAIITGMFIYSLRTL
jgi:RsiW-degrading membrane proteinase PrsW (M82 family)